MIFLVRLLKYILFRVELRVKELTILLIEDKVPYNRFIKGLNEERFTLRLFMFIRIVY